MRASRALPARRMTAACLFIALLSSVFLAACGGKPEPSPTPTKTPTLPVSPTATSTATAALVTASRPKSSATATATPVGTATATLTPAQQEPEPTATPAVNAWAVSAIGAGSPDEAELDSLKEADAAERGKPQQPRTPNTASTPVPRALVAPTPTPVTASAGQTEINPLTGLPVASWKLNRRPLGVKIPNFPPEARPQSGLSRADVVFEHEAEARLTRFTAIFWGNDVTPELGPIRSVRLVDGELMPIFKSTLVASGGHPAVKIRVTEGKSWPEGYRRVICPEEPFLGDGGTLRRVPKAGRRYELTLYSDTPTLWNLVSARGVNHRPDFSGWWAFSEDPPGGGAGATHLRIVYKPTWSIAEYRYNPDTRTYLRYDLGQPTVDALTGWQIAPPNVLVLYVNHVDSDIAADAHDPQNIYYSVIIQLWGEGTGKLLRDGMVYDIRWRRENSQQSNDRLVFSDGAGQPIPLRPGAVWIQLVRPDADIQIR